MTDQHAEYVRPSDAYVRPRWTGRPLTYSDGKQDFAWSECPSCLGFHHARSKSCNGKREFSDHQCEQVMGEIQCHRPSNHLGAHEAKGDGFRVEWERQIDGPSS